MCLEIPGNANTQTIVSLLFVNYLFVSNPRVILKFLEFSLRPHGPGEGVWALFLPDFCWALTFPCCCPEPLPELRWLLGPPGASPGEVDQVRLLPEPLAPREPEPLGLPCIWAPEHRKPWSRERRLRCPSLLPNPTRLPHSETQQ